MTPRPMTMAERRVIAAAVKAAKTRPWSWELTEIVRAVDWLLDERKRTRKGKKR